MESAQSSERPRRGTGGEQLADCGVQALERFGVGHGCEHPAVRPDGANVIADVFVVESNIGV
jgi:hypothetical protein